MLTVLIFAVFAGILLFGFFRVDAANDSEDLDRVTSAVREGIIECYAVEGKYPDSLQYLCDNYGVYYNEDLYQIHYRYLGMNIMPEYKVFVKGEN